MTLFSLAGFMLSLNDFDGLQHGNARRGEAQAFLDDLLAGVPIHQLVIRHSGVIHPVQKGFWERLQILRERRAGHFKQLQEDPPFYAVPLATLPAEVQDVTFDQSTWNGTGADSSLTFTLAKQTLVFGIRLTYTFANPTQKAAHFRVSWKQADQPDFPDNQQYEDWAFETNPAGAVTTFWIAEVMDEFRFRPDTEPWQMRLIGIWLLVDAKDPAATAANLQPPQTLRVLTAKGFYSWESWGNEGRVRWCQPQGEFYLVNPSDTPLEGLLELACLETTGRLTLDGPPLVTAQLELDGTPRTWSQRLTIPPGIHRVRFTCNAKQDAPDDPRHLSFLMKKLTLTKLASIKD
jgi:hypothetical protein